MSNLQNDKLLQVETTCGSLLYELQLIWDEVGEPDTERDKMLLELEQECLEVYRRKVDQANKCRAQLRQAIADSEAALAAICSSMGERPVHLRQPDQNAGSLKEELTALIPQLEEMQKMKNDRVNQFLDVLGQIQKISEEICRPFQHNQSKIVIDESDLSLRKLEEFHRQLQALQKEKTDRLKQIMEQLNTLNSLCSVLGLDFKHTISEIHPSLDDSELPRNISDDTIERLATAIQRLREIKIQRMQKLQDLATTMLELWNLMDTPVEEQQMFQSVTRNIAALEHEITEPNTLSIDFINYVESEVSRLEELKASKMKELVLKKRSELEDICRRTHMVAEIDDSMEYAITAVESGAVDPSSVLEQIELLIARVKEEAFSRKEILERVEKWLAACEEESWLEDYNRDENRYNAGRGAHLTLKRAEKARAAVSKLPAMVEALISKSTAWERERGTEFMYDGVRLLSMLEEYSILRQEKEQERRRQRDQKKLQGQLIAEQEVLYGSKPSPSKPQSGRKLPRTSTGSVNRRLSLGGSIVQPHSVDFPASMRTTHGTTIKTATPSSIRKGDRSFNNDSRNHHLDDGVGGLSAGRRGLDVAGLSVKKHPFNASNIQENEASMLRKPFSPVATLSSRATTTNFVDDQQKLSNAVMLKTTLLNKTPQATPTKRISVTDEENQTPKSIPTTPSAPIPMQTATTPAVFCNSETAAREVSEEIEYSFEERRLGFVIPKTLAC